MKDATGQALALAYVYARDSKADADAAKVLTMDEARRVASNIAKLPGLLLCANSQPASQRLKVQLGERHRHAWAGRPSPDVTHHTADETLTKSVDLDERSIAASTGAVGHRVMPRSASARRTTTTVTTNDAPTPSPPARIGLGVHPQWTFDITTVQTIRYWISFHIC